MRKINTRSFHVATRTTSRDLNRHIALYLIREHQRISRGNLARRMNLIRGVVSVLVHELIAQEAIHEGATGEAARGLKPTLLRIRTHDRPVVAVNVRFSRTYLMLCDFSGRQVAIESYDTVFSIPDLVKGLAAGVRKLLKRQGLGLTCEGTGLIAPGRVDQRTGKFLNAPALRWRDVDIRTNWPRRLDWPCTSKILAELRAWRNCGWLAAQRSANITSSTSASRMASVPASVKGKLLTGRNQIAGEFGRMPLNLEGPLCCAAATGRWEAYASNLATLSRYFGWNLSKDGPKRLQDAERSSFTVLDMIARPRSGDAKAMAAALTGRQPGPAEL
ncbi:MAG: hypothetical protein QOF72_2833 [Blastocatellia bacterium]|nr:hypothetical protein [Blastocatellia bacterium]